MNISFMLNGKRTTCEIAADTSLFELLRKQGCMSVKCGCETSNCGLCTVWIDGKPQLSCSVLAARVGGRDVTTLEGLQEESHAFAVCMAEEGAEQCGFCSPGLVMTVLAFERELAGRVPSDDEVRRYLAGNLCRCTGYMSQTRAIRRYLGMPSADASGATSPHQDAAVPAPANEEVA